MQECETGYGNDGDGRRYKASQTWELLQKDEKADKQWGDTYNHDLGWEGPDSQES